MKEFKLINGNKIEFRIPKGAKVVMREVEEKDMSLERLAGAEIPAPCSHPKDDYEVIEIHKPTSDNNCKVTVVSNDSDSNS